MEVTALKVATMEVTIIFGAVAESAPLPTSAQAEAAMPPAEVAVLPAEAAFPPMEATLNLLRPEATLLPAMA